MDFSTITNLLQTGGPAGVAAVFFWMWWLERRDRRDAQASLFELATASIEATTKTEVAVNTLSKLIEQRRRD